MADMIRAATPITNKNIVQPLREHHDAEDVYKRQRLLTWKSRPELRWILL